MVNKKNNGTIPLLQIISIVVQTFYTVVCILSYLFSYHTSHRYLLLSTTASDKPTRMLSKRKRKEENELMDKNNYKSLYARNQPL